jgi:hypothetical protein
MLGALGMVKSKKQCLASYIESRRVSAKTNCSNFFHGDMSMAETNFFAFGFLRSTKQKNCLGHALSF